MAKVGRPSSGKGKLISLRLTPKMRYCVELLARVQRRNSITAVIEFALDSLMQDSKSGLYDASGSYLPDLIWDEDEIYCFVKLCLHRPELLTYDEELVWRVIEGNGGYWKEFRVPDFEKIKTEWNEINSQAKKARQ